MQSDTAGPKRNVLGGQKIAREGVARWLWLHPPTCC